MSRVWKGTGHSPRWIFPPTAARHRAGLSVRPGSSCPSRSSRPWKDRRWPEAWSWHSGATCASWRRVPISACTTGAGGIPLIDGGTVRLPRLVGQARAVAEQLAHDISRFPQGSVRSDRMSVYRQHGLPVHKALETEWRTSIGIVTAEGISGAARFNAGNATETIRTSDRVNGTWRTI